MEEMAEGEVIGLVCVQVPDRPLLLLLQLGPAVLVEGERDNGGQQEIMSHNKVVSQLVRWSYKIGLVNPLF